MCDKVIELGYVYALHCEGDIFYIGSSKNIKKRIATYKRYNCHGNKRLLANVKKGFQVKILFYGEGFRKKEVELIKTYNPKCNYSISVYNNKRFGHFWAYVTNYKNRFGETNFINEISCFFQLQTCEEKETINKRFQNIFTRKRKIKVLAV